MRISFVCVSAAVLSSSVAVCAEPLTGDSGSVFKNSAFSADVSIGVLRGQANELVFNPDGSLLSRLKWRLDNDAVITGSLNWTPLDWFTIGVRGRTNLSDDATLDDFDFPGAVCGVNGPFCQSHHINTTVDNADSVDVYGIATLYKDNTITLGGIAGYRWDHYGFTAVGGLSNYAPPFPDIPGISYDQYWEVPYLGLQASGKWDKFTFQGRLIGSLWATGNDRDDHKLRELLFTEKFGNSDYVGVSIKAGYAISDTISLTAGYDYDRFFLARGLITVTDYGFGAPPITIPADAATAGADLDTHTISAGIKFTY